MSNINIDINSTHQNVEITVGETPQNVDVTVSEFRGRSAYQVWLDAGNTGSLEDFFLIIGRVDAETSASLIETFETRGRGILSGSVTNYIPVIVSQSSQIQINDVSGFTSFSSSVDSRLTNIEEFSSSLDATFATDLEISQSSENVVNYINAFTQSYYTDSSSFDNRIDELESFSSSLSTSFVTDLELSQTSSFLQTQIDEKLNTGSFLTVSQSIDSRLDLLESQSGSFELVFNEYTESTDNRLQSLEIESGSVRTELNNYTSSTDLRIGSLESESGSIRSTFNLFTQSVTTEQSTQNNRLSTLETESGSVRIELNAYTQSTDIRLNSLETESVSVRSDFNTFTQSVSLEQSVQNNRLDGLSTESASIRLELNSYTESNDTLNTTQNNRLDLLSTESSSIRNEFNSYTQSSDLRIQSLENESGSIRSVFNSYTSSNDTLNITQNDRLDGLSTESSSIRFTFNSYTSSNDTINSTQNSRLDGLSTESESIRTDFNTFTESQNSLNQTFATTGSNIFNGNQIINGDLILSGDLTAKNFYIDSASILFTSGSTKFGDSEDDIHQFTGSVKITGSITLNGEPIGTGKLDESVFNVYTQSIDTRLDSLEGESGSVRSELNSYTQSANSRLDSLETESGSIRTNFNSYTQSNDDRLGSIETTTSSLNTSVSNLNSFTQSSDLRLQNLETESGSIRTNFNSYTSSTDGRIDELESFSSSLDDTFATDSELQTLETSLQNDINTRLLTSSFNDYTSSTDSRLGLLETESGSIRSTFNSYTSSNDNRLQSLETESGSVRAELNTYTSSTDNRLSSLEIESGSVRTELNEYTSSTNVRLQSLETESGSVVGRLNNVENFTSSQNVLNQTFATTGSNIFNGNQTINGNLVIDGDLTVKNFYIESSSVLFTSGSTKFGDSEDDIHQFTGSVKITGSISLNGEPIGTGKLDESVFNEYTQSTDLRVQSLETESGSIRSEFNSYTQSINTEQTIQNNRLQSLETESGSIRTELNNYTSSADSRLGLLETESGSIRTTLNSYTQSTDSRLDNIESVSGSWVKSDITASTLITASVFENVITFTKGDNTTFDITVQASGSIISGLVSGSDQLTSSYDSRYEKLGSDILSGSVLNYIPVIVSQSSQIDLTSTTNYTEFSSSITNTFASQSVRLDGIDLFTSSADGRLDNIELTTSSFELRLDSLETESGSIRTVFSLFTQSINTEQTTQNNRLDGLSTESGSIRSTFNLYTSSNDAINSTQNSRLDGLSTESGSIRTTLNNYTQSTDNRVSLLETESGSIRSTLNNYTQSTDNRLDSIEIESASIRTNFNSYTSSTDLRVQSLESESGSIRTIFNQFTSSYNTGSFTGSFIGDLVGNSSTSTSASYALTASYVEWNNVDNKPELVSESIFNSYTSSVNPRLDSLETESGSIKTEFNSYTQSTDLRLQSLETESGSIRTNFNSYTQSTNDRLNNIEITTSSINSFTESISLKVNNLETESGSIRADFNSYTASNDNLNITQNSRLVSLETESGSIRTIFNSYTSSNDTLNTIQNNRLDDLSTESGSIRTTLNTYTSSNNQRVQSLEIESASVRGRLINIENFSSSQLVLNPTFATTGSNIFIGNQTISGSVIQSGSFTQTGSFSQTGSFTQTGSFIVNGLRYPETADGEFTFFQYDGLGNVILEYAETLYERVYNPSLSQIPRGTPLYVSGSVGANARVFIADAADPLKMPVIYIAGDNIEPVSEGRGILLGLITGVNTTGYGPGTEIYVAPGGGWTDVRPTGSAIVQTLGIVTKEGNGGQGVVLNPGPNNIPNLTTGHFWIGNENWLPTPIPTSSFTTTSSFNEYTSSANGRLTRLETESGSIRSTFNSYTQSSNLRLNTIEAQTSSYARLDTSNTFTNLQTFTDINVNGTASFAYIQSVTGSSTSIGDAFIILNENTPASNFAGIKVVDSGSSFTTASFVYDGLNNNWVFQHEGSEDSGSSLAIFGPLSLDGLGTEIGLTENRIPKAVTNHGHHIGDSNISDDGVKVQITLPLNVTNDITGSTITATTSFIGTLNGTADTASYVQWNSVDNKPLLVSQSTFDNFQTQTNNRLSSIEVTTGSINSSLANIHSFTESIDLRVGKLEVESGSIRTNFNSYTSSNDTINTTQNSRLDSLSTESGSIRTDFNNFTGSYNTGSFSGSFVGDGSELTNLPIPDIDTSTLVTTSSFNAYTSSTDNRLGSLEVESGSIRTDLNTSISNFNSYTSSTDNSLDSLEVESGSIRTDFNSFTSSINSEQTTQNSRLGSLEIESGSIRTDFNNFTGSYNTGSFSGSFTGSLTGTSTTASYVEFSNIDNIPSGLISGSVQISSLGFAITGSNTFTAGQTISSGNLDVNDRVGIGIVASERKVDIDGGEVRIGQSSTGIGAWLSVNLRNGTTALAAGRFALRSTASDSEVIPITQPNLILNRGSDGFGTLLKFTNQRTGFAGIGSAADANDLHDIRFYSGDGSERIRINSSGSVGIGKTTPTATLDVLGNVLATSFTGSFFTGSFKGDGSELTNIPITAVNTSTLVTTSSFNSYTSSNDITNVTQTGRLDLLSTFTGSAIERLDSIESFTSSINTTIKTQLDVNTVISSSSQIRTLTYYREDVSGQESYNINHNLNEFYPIVQVYESGSNEQVIPLKIKSNSVNQVLVEFTSIFSGSIIVKS